LWRFFHRFLGNAEAAEEATQEVFLKMIGAAKSYEPNAKFTTWMFRISHNYAIDCFRKGKLRKTVSLDQPISEESGPALFLDRIADQTAMVEEDLVNKELHDQLTQALEMLNPDQKAVFLMRENMNLAFHEIAEILNLSTNTVKSRMRYALAALRKILKPKFQPQKQVARS
jgi:RNA polymerase sigma-70 factor (ECF subfamily)